MPSKLGSILDMANMVIKNLGAPVAATDASTKKYVDDQVALASGGAVVPPGVIQMYGGSTAPTGWVLCQGQSVPRTGGTYDALFAVIGTNFGMGANSPTNGTFNLPDMRTRVPIGVGAWGSLGTTELGAQAAVVNAGGAEDSGRVERWSHIHDHTFGTLTNASTDLNLATNTTTGGTASRIMQQNHTHTISGRTQSTTALANPGSVHATTAMNFIIKL